MHNYFIFLFLKIPKNVHETYAVVINFKSRSGLSEEYENRAGLKN